MPKPPRRRKSSPPKTRKMLNVGFSELVLTSAIALVAIGPKELPGALRQLAKWWRELQAFSEGMKQQLQEVVREVEGTGRTIIDLEGKPQQAYDVSELEKLAAPKPLATPEKPVE